MRLVTVRGDSMYPDIKNGDVVFVDVAKDYFDGDGLYLINLHGLTYVKRLQLLRDGLHVISTNRKYLSEVVPPHEADQLHVGGKIWLICCAARRKSDVRTTWSVLSGAVPHAPAAQGMTKIRPESMAPTIPLKWT